MSVVDFAGTRATAAREAVAALCESTLDPLELLGEAAERIRAVVPFEGGAWMTCDPETILPTGGVMFEPDPEVSSQIMRNEMMVPDLNKFSDMASAGRTVATLREATAGQLELSPRAVTIHHRKGLHDELRVVFRTAEGLWGGACAYRADDTPPFSPEESRWIGAIGDELGRGLRRALAARAGEDGALTGTGMLVLGPDGRVELSSGEADRWLARLPSDTPGALPMAIGGVAMRAQALAAGGVGGPPARARVRLSNGQWLLVHASVLRDAAGAPDRTAVVLEPAERSRIAGMLLTLFGLSGREREVAELLIRGLATDEVAERLTISRHTVRDHVKAIFAKVGVSSRPELTALVAAGGD